jgi:hypothetical protein
MVRVTLHDFSRSEPVFLHRVGRLHIGAFSHRRETSGRAHVAKWMIRIVAPDARDASERSRTMGHALRVLGYFVGVEEAENLVRVRPGAILEDRPPGSAPQFPFRGRPDMMANWIIFGRVVRFFRG